MHIGLIAPPWGPVPPGAYGGTEAVVDRLARGLAGAGHDVLLFTTGDAMCPVERAWVLEESAGDRIGAVDVELRHVLHAYEVVKHCDVVHDHTVAGALAVAWRHPSLPVVLTNHGPFDGAMADILAAVAERVAIVAISEHHASTAPAGQVSRVIHHGIDVDTMPVGDGDGGFALFLGRMTAEKGPARAVEVARRAEVPLVIAAKMREKPEVEYFHDEVEHRLGDDARYVGEVDEVTKTKLLGQAVALVNPIRWPEPFGLVMIEALARGTPVVSFAEGAATEIVEDGVTGFLCHDDDEMVDRLRRVGDLDRDACRRAAEARFTTERMVAAHVDLYESVAAGR
ncbi:MAG TPA: glycosyltransferase family 4 protein [Acidimicrobiales bacterium]|nr:glycosyltransferase family 4 protein [Acidimicrobiales bacterium]